jgi:hypothetical protein
MIGHLSIDWVPLVPWALLAALGAGAAGLAAFALWRRAPGIWWRALALATLLLALANPTLIEEERETLSDVALVVVDRSPSQNIAERAEQTERALSGLLERLERLPDTEVRVIDAGADAISGKVEGTQLFAAVRDALANLPRGRVGGVLIVSDGQIHDAPQSAD